MVRRASTVAGSALVALGLSLGLAGCGTTHTSPPITGVAHVTGCPSKAANEPSGQSVTSHREDLVSLTPTGAVVCSYSATTPDWVAKSLAAGEAKRLGTLLNQAGSNITPGSASSCPADFGGTVVVYLWSARQTSTVWIHTGGCRVATNGITSREGAYAGSLAAYLHRTVKSPAA